jgi:hypothetical protein
VTATEAEGGRWRTSRALGDGESAVVGSGCIQDEFGNYNGNASGGVPDNPRNPVDGCPVSDPAEDGGGTGSGAGTGPSNGQGGGGGPTGGGRGVGEAIGKVLGKRRDSGRCTRPVGRARGRTLGRARLGRPRTLHRKSFRDFAKRRVRVDRFCLTDRRHIRIGYPPRRLLRSLARGYRRRVSGRAVLVLTSSTSYALRGVRPGSSFASLRRRVRRLAGPYRVGANRWYLAPGASSRLVFKVRGGRVREVGIASLRLTRGRRARRFLKSFS